MNKVKIIVDSTVDLTKEIYEKYDIEVLPLNVSFEEETYQDGVNLDITTLFKKVEETGKLPHTSACSPELIRETFKKYIDMGMDIIFLGLSSTMSSNFQNAFIAKASFKDDRIYLVDSKSLSTGTGLLVLKAAKLVEAGKCAKEIAEELEKTVPNVVAQFTIEQLEYLHKGGRCSGASKIFGHIFHIRPYIKVKDGEMYVYKKPRGPMKIAVNEQLQDIKEALPNVDQSAVIITHSLVSDELLEYTKAELAKIVDPKSIIVTTSGCVISSHCGKGCIGILYLINK
ncbi:MAG: DegV family protein [Bacilli bacterium]|nr:DegV family protein [Bacilli bacterium]